MAEGKDKERGKEEIMRDESTEKIKERKAGSSPGTIFSANGRASRPNTRIATSPQLLGVFAGAADTPTPINGFSGGDASTHSYKCIFRDGWCPNPP